MEIPVSMSTINDPSPLTIVTQNLALDAAGVLDLRGEL